ncbi:MAG: response regulator [Anaerolineae bacterium]
MRLAELLEAHARGTLVPADPLSQEMEALARRPQPVQLVEMLQACISALHPLASRHSILLKYAGPEGGITVRATPGVLKQAMMQLLSAVVQNSGPGEVSIQLDATEGVAVISVLIGPVAALAREDLLQTALRVLAAQGLSHELVSAGDGILLQLHLPLAKHHCVLILEDNASASALYERYLAESEWEPVLVPHPSLVGNLAITRRAQAIILDVMMPEIDGWSILQTLRLDERLRQIPVVICSVVNDPELGHALGATGYLTKPVSRLELLEALEQAAQERKSASDAADTDGSDLEFPPRQTRLLR